MLSHPALFVFREFPTGIDKQGKWNAEDYIALLQQMPFVVGHTDDIIKSTSARKAFVEACMAVRTLIIVLKMREVSEDDLAIMHRYAAKPLGPLMEKAVGTLSELPKSKSYTTARPKVHALIHFRYFIRRYGCALNFDSAVWEAGHKVVSHDTYARDCNRREGRERRLMQQTNRKAILRVVMEEDVPDPPIRVHRLFFKSPRPSVEGRHPRPRHPDSYLRIQGVLNDRVKHLPYTEFNLRALLKRHFKGNESFNQALDMPVFDVVKEDFGEDTCLYVASMVYRNRGPRHDFVSIIWEDYPCPAQLVLLFGRGKEWKRGGEDQSSGAADMYALVRIMQRAKPPSPELSSTMEYLYLRNAGENKSYTIVHVDSIDGHARIVQDFTPVIRRHRHDTSYSYFWWDNVRPSDALAPLLKKLRKDEESGEPEGQFQEESSEESSGEAGEGEEKSDEEEGEEESVEEESVEEESVEKESEEEEESHEEEPQPKRRKTREPVRKKARRSQ